MFKPKDQRNPTMKMIFLKSSRNAKTGDIMQSYSSKSSCPNRCPFKGSGCYAEGIRTVKTWERADNETDKRFVSSQDELRLDLIGGVIEHIKEPEKELLFRHNIAGDLAISGTNTFNTHEFLEIANAIIRANAVCSELGKVVKGFTYTHCELTEGDKYVINSMKGVMTVNASTDSVIDAYISKTRGFNTVLTSVNPKDDIRKLREAHGLNAVQCPAQTREGITCNSCRLCAKDRDAIVIFGIHGAQKSKARKAIQIHRAKLK